MLRLCVLQCVLFLLCVPDLGIAQDVGPKEEALALFEDYAPTIEEEEGPITYERPIQGDLNGDGSQDVLVEFGIGGEGGMSTLYKQVAIYLNTDDGMQVVGGFEPEYCPSVDRIEGGTVYVEQLEACALPHPEPVVTHQYVFDSGSLTWQPASFSGDGANVEHLTKEELPMGIDFEGEFVQAKRWQDENGAHVFLAYERDGSNTKYGVNNVELFAKQITIGPDERVVWDVYDYVRECGTLDHSLQLDTSATSITDLDSDDVTETTLVYEKFCGGGIAAFDLKVLMMEGDEKYGLRGKTFAPLVEGVEIDLDAFEFNLSKATSGDSEPRTYPNQSVENGRYETAEDFADAPSGFLEFARKMWKETVRP